MARTRSEAFETLYALEIGQEAVVQPLPGETVERALRRVKERVARWAKDERSYRCRIDNDVIRVQRTRFGMNGPLADLQALSAGEYLLISDAPTPYEIKKVRDRADYASSASEGGRWTPIVDQSGRLLILCFIDVDGRVQHHIRSENVAADAVIRKPWGSE